MKMSEYLRQWQITGKVPDGDAFCAFWSGWLTACGRNSQTVFNFDDAREMAIKACEFIEQRAVQK